MKLSDFEKMPTTYPKSLVTDLARLPPRTWRAVRAEVRWRYSKWDLTPPLALRKHMSTLWDDANHWYVLCTHVNLIRDAERKRKKRMRSVKEAKKERQHKRDYMRAYMQEYRRRRKYKSTGG